MALDLIKKGDFHIEPTDDLQNGKLSPEKVREILFKNKIVFGDKIRPVFTGVYFDERGRAVATDTHIIIVYKFSKNDERYDDLKGKIIDKEGNEIEGKYAVYDKVFRNKTDYCFEIKIDKKLLSFLYKLDKQTKNRTSAFYVRYNDVIDGINIYTAYNTKLLYRLFKALYELGETKVFAYSTEPYGDTIFIGEHTKSMIMSYMTGSSYGELAVGNNPFYEMEGYDTQGCYATNDFEQFLANYREGKINLDEVKKPIMGNFATMLKMFEENGIQTEFVDTNEKIVERLKKEGHSDENINFSLQEDFELDDEDNEPKQGTLNFGFWEYQSAKKIAKDVHNHWIDEHKGSANAYNDIVKQIENYQEAGYTDEMIVRNILDHAKRWYRWHERQMFDEIEKIPETTRSAYLTITKKDEGNDKE